MGSSIRLGVAGNPVAHSLSPDIHSAFAASLGLEIDYQRYLFPEDGFQREAAGFFATQGLGLNVTVPFKQEAYDFAHTLHPLAEAAGAVNTLLQQDGKITGFNTDGIGMVRDLQARHHIDLSGRSALILGAGGACRGLIQPLLDAGVDSICIANRTLSRAQDIVDHFAGLGTTGLQAVALGAMTVGSQAVDLVFNSTSMGLGQDAVALPEELVADRVCYDLSYGSQAHFARWAREHGASVSLDGLGMLVEQAAESFGIWLGQRPDTDPVYAQLRQLSDAASRKVIDEQ